MVLLLKCCTFHKIEFYFKFDYLNPLHKISGNIMYNAGNGNDQNFQGVGVFSKIFRPGGYFTGSFEF